MHSRSRLLLAVLLSAVAGACASGGGTPTDETEPRPTDTAERTFPPGTEPSRNMWTRSAQIYIDQAETAVANDEREAEFTQALAQARLSIENQPQNPLGYYQAGISLIGLDRFEEAGQMLDRAEEIYPRYVLETGPRRQNAWIGLYNAAVVALQEGNEDVAIEQMQLADMIFQGRPEARTNLAVIYTNRGEYETALEWYRRTLETLRSEDVQYMPQDVQEQWAEDEGDVIFNMAQVYQRMDRPAEAITLYQEYLQDNPRDASVKVQLGLLLSAQDRDEEATEIFTEVLGMENLEDDEYYQIGIGLFNAGRFDDAVTAFERAVAANPHFRDAVFNLSQALLAQAGQQQAAGASDVELVALYERLAQIGEALREIDPFSRTPALVLANAYRALADIATGAEATTRRNQLSTLLRELEEMPFEVSSLALTQTGAGRIQLSGVLENLALTPGTPITLRVSLLGPGGNALVTEDVTVEAPELEAQTSFRSEFAVESEIAGWSYERVE